MTAPHHGGAEHHNRSATPVLLRLSACSMGGRSSHIDEHKDSDAEPGQNGRFEIVHRQPVNRCWTGTELPSKCVVDR